MFPRNRNLLNEMQQCLKGNIFIISGRSLRCECSNNWKSFVCECSISFLLLGYKLLSLVLT